MVTSKHDGDFCCLKCVHLYSTKDYQNHYNVCKNHDYCYVEMPKKDKILKENHREIIEKSP